MKCIFHRIDFDGMCSGAIVKHFHPDCEMIGINHGEPFPWEILEENEQIFMVDFSLPIEDMKRLNNFCMLTWIDHHDTAIRAAHEAGFLTNAGMSLNNSKAACELTWEWFYPTEKMPLGVFLLGRWDVWDHAADPDTEKYQYGMRTYPDTHPDNQEFWKDIFSGIKDVDIVIKGNLILIYENKQNAMFAESHYFLTDIDGYMAIALNKGMTNSKAFDSVYDENDHDLMLTFVRTPKKQWRISMYTTNKDVHVGNIAKKFGGGGHPGAAGFICETLPFDI